MARREKQPVHKVVMTEGKRNIVHQLLEEYDIQTAEDIQEALKDLLGTALLLSLEPKHRVPCSSTALLLHPLSLM